MHNLLLVHFVDIYMFQAYLGPPSSGGTTIRMQQLVLTTLFRRLFVVLVPIQSGQQTVI